MNKSLLLLGAVSGLLALVLGAFGSHGLENVLSEQSLATFEVGVRYQFYHALLALFIANFSFLTASLKKYLFWGLFLGMLFFSGSIYLLSTKTLTGVDISTVAFITPLGGLLLMSVWLALIVNFLKMKIK